MRRLLSLRLTVRSGPIVLKNSMFDSRAFSRYEATANLDWFCGWFLSELIAPGALMRVRGAFVSGHGGKRVLVAPVDSAGRFVLHRMCATERKKRCEACKHKPNRTLRRKLHVAYLDCAAADYKRCRLCPGVDPVGRRTEGIRNE